MKDYSANHTAIGGIKNVVIIPMTGLKLMDFTGPADVFTTANHFLRESGSKDGYDVHIAAPNLNRKIRTNAGIEITCDICAMDILKDIDTLIISNYEFEDVQSDLNEHFYSWLSQRTEKNTRRLASVCAGTFVLAKSGLIDEQRVTTHWALNDRLQSSYPKLKVDSNFIHIKDGYIHTCGGVTSGIDLALAMVEEDFGRDLASKVARDLVVYLYRPGFQSQFGSLISSYNSIDISQKLMDYCMNHLSEVLDVQRLADYLNMSSRNFTRVFNKQTGMSPAKFVEKIRVEHARKLLEETDYSLEHITDLCGLGHLSSMRRSFLKLMMTTPSDYRRAFRNTH